MPALTPDQLAALARHGALNREIESSLGREMNADERGVVDRARVVWRLQRQQKRAAGPKSKSDQKRIERARDMVIERRPCADPKRRRRLEAHPERWLRHYKADNYPLPFSAVHRALIAAAVRSMRDGAGVAVAAPRGFGKSTLLGDLAEYGVLSGLCRFPVVVGWQHSAAKRLYRGWLNDLADNAALAEDYPELCDPFRESVQAKRVRSLTWPDGQNCGADVRQTEGFLVLSDGRGALAAASIRGSVRGLRIESGGTWLRPDVLLLDDPQDKPTARSAELVKQVVERIDSDLLSLAGPSRRIAVMAAVTVIEPDDVAEALLNRRDMEAIRCAQVVTWPAGWDKRDSESRRLWAAWNEVRLDGVQAGDGGKAARTYYRRNKSAMVAGLSVSWRARYDKGRGEPDALYSAMWDYYRLGEAAFMAERQNQPLRRQATVYDLTPEIVMSRATERAPFTVPDWARVLTIGTDINHYGLHTVALALGNDHTAAVVWYGRHDHGGNGLVPETATEAERKALIFEALVEHGRQIADAVWLRGGARIHPGAWLIDGGYLHDVAQRYAIAHGRLLGVGHCIVARGFNSRAYRPTPQRCIGQPREQCHLTQFPLGPGLAWNADYWREVSQRAWLGSVEAPGSCSLYAGHHREFSEHVCREKLVEKLFGDSGVVWVYHKAPGRNDWGDALGMAYVGAAWAGIGTGGPPHGVRSGPVERRRCKVAVED